MRPHTLSSWANSRPPPPAAPPPAGRRLPPLPSQTALWRIRSGCGRGSRWHTRHVTSENLTCEWCGRPFERTNSKGPRPRFWTAANRQRAYEARTGKGNFININLGDISPSFTGLAESLQAQLAATIPNQATWLENLQAQIAATIAYPVLLTSSHSR